MDDQTVNNDAISAGTTERPTSEPLGTASSDTPSATGTAELETLKAELDILRVEHQAVHDKHIRLFAEFDNFRKRTAKEKLEMLQFAGENALKAVLPILDDMDRAVANNETLEDIVAMRDGFKLIQQKFQHIMASQGLKVIPDAKGEVFDTDRHEAITKAPAPSPELIGKVIDVVEKGYTLHDKVIRYAKVVVGE
jgi:molecular chaperone GrpE